MALTRDGVGLDTHTSWKYKRRVMLDVKCKLNFIDKVCQKGGMAVGDQMGPGLISEGSRCSDILGHRNAQRLKHHSAKEGKLNNISSYVQSF